MRTFVVATVNVYLIFSSNFVGVFCSQRPPSSSGPIEEDGGDVVNPPHSGGSRSYQALVSRSHLLPRPLTRTKVTVGEQDTIDLSRISRPRAKVLLQPVDKKHRANSINRFDAFGDYVYVDADQYRPEPPLSGPRNVNQYRRGDFEPPVRRHRWSTGQRQPHRHTNWKPYFTSFGSSRNDFQKLENNLPLSHNRHRPPASVPQRNPAQNLPPPPAAAAPGIAEVLLNLVGLGSGSNLVNDHNSIEAPHLDPYGTPYGPGYQDYEYGDYNEGIGLYPPRKQTISERVLDWFKDFQPSSAAKRKTSNRKPPGNRLAQSGGSLNYDDYETGDDQNLIFHDGSSNNYQYGFSDVLSSIKNNETGVEVAKKLLSASASLSERAGANPVFMMWTLPTTVLAILGGVYILGAVAIVGFRYSTSLIGGSGNDGEGLSLIPILLVFSVPLVVALFIVTARSSFRGEIDLRRALSGNIGASMRQDFDGVDFTMDALFGSASMMGIAWLLSIAL